MNELSRREQEVLELVVEGRSNAEIARELSLTKRGVEFHLTQAYRKLGVASRAQAIVRVLAQK